MLFKISNTIRHLHKTLIACFFASTLLFQYSCKEPFEPILNTPQTGYLVVEGFINPKGLTTIKLSRAQNLEKYSIKSELKANLQIVGENLVAYQVKEKDNGFYESDSLNLPNQKYQLKIKTADGKEYQSKLIEPKTTPLIDSISWERGANGVEIKVNSHDDQNKTRYYKWSFDEVWEIHSLFPVIYKFIRDTIPNSNQTAIGVVERTQSETDQIYNCWQSGSSNQILLGSSAKLSKDVVSAPINFITNGNPRLSVLYSIKLKQMALDLDGYNFFVNLKNNTETNGSIFDRQPSETGGNIICISDPKERVIGYVGVSSLQEQRIFIPTLKNWNYKFDCSNNVLKISINQDTLAKYAGFYQPIVREYSGTILTGVQIISNECVDCTTRGTNIKPSFWPN